MMASCPAGCAGKLEKRFVLHGAEVGLCGTCGAYVLESTAGASASEDLDRLQFEDALRALRQLNYAHVLESMRQLKDLRGTCLLDVGCSIGWFLTAFAEAGGRGYGIEPDEFFYSRLATTVPQDVLVTRGFFPADLPAAWPGFDWITFHDVFEHLPHPVQVLQSVRERLQPDGFLVLSLPSADGFVFQIGRLLYRLGVSAPMDRLFQVRYPFPHLYFFARRSIAALASRAGFEVVRIERLRSFAAQGALQRARMSRARNALDKLRSYADAAALLAFAAAERFLPADSMLVVLRPKNPAQKDVAHRPVT